MYYEVPALNNRIVNETFIMGQIVAATEGIEWPDGAEFKVEYKTKTWPCGYDRETTKRYFSTQEELDLWLFDQLTWSRMEDNGMMIQLYKWDLGPTFVREINY